MRSFFHGAVIYPGYISLMTDERYMSMEHFEIIFTDKNRRTRRTNFPTTILPTTDPTETDKGSNAGYRGTSPANNLFIIEVLLS
jgi:hypothetical protein